MATRTLPTVLTTIARRGRASIDLTLLGEAGRGPRTPADVSVLRGTPLDALVMVAAERGIDAAEALAAGINALSIERAKQDHPGILAMVRDRLHIENPKDARLAAMHLKKAAAFLGRDPESCVTALELAEPAPTP